MLECNDGGCCGDMVVDVVVAWLWMLRWHGRGCFGDRYVMDSRVSWQENCGCRTVVKTPTMLR